MKKEEHEKRFPVAKEDIGTLLIAAVCLGITLYLFFGPSPVKMLFHDKPADAPVAAQSTAAPPPAAPNMMPANAVPSPEPAEKPEKTKP